MFVSVYVWLMAIENMPMREWAAMILVMWLVINATVYFIDTAKFFE